ncbi:MAG: L-threonylcarbamoyladenylate synthase [Chloroflexi bacterium]|nr:L-threonylcarbamoyladenylate synthase [Chloroflexota bacterium]
MPIVPPERADAVVRKLLAGGVAAIPTDTAYGVAALATRADAVRALAHLKGRGEDQPVALLFDSAAVVAGYLADPRALDRVMRFWPGALTAVVRVRPGCGLSAPAVAADGTIGVRKPNDPIARLVIRECGGLLAVTSANRHGEPPAATARAVVATFGMGLLILDGGERPGALQSTVVDLTCDPPRIVREGALSAEELGLPPPA